MAKPETASKQIHRQFRHPLTQEEIGYDPAHLSPVERVRLLCDPVYLPGYERLLFETLFPPDLPLKPFSPEGVSKLEETKLNDQDKALWRELLINLGFQSPRKSPHDSSYIPELHVGFTNDTDHLVTHVNNLPLMKRLEQVAQISPLTDATRADHTKHLMLIVARDVIRYAIQTPNLFLAKVTQDMERYKEIYQMDHPGLPVTQFSVTPDPKKINEIEKIFNRTHVFGQLDLDVSHGHFEIHHHAELKIQAVATAMEYLPYILLAVALHDTPTPGWGDVFMKTKARGPGQLGANYSEDEALRESICRLVIDPTTKLPQLLTKFSIDPKLLTTIVKSTASESDICLPGLLFKDKRKKSLLSVDAVSNFTMGESYDHDQESGTITNIAELANLVLPGGFKHLSRTDEIPFLSFESRAMILCYGLLSRLSKDDLARALIQLEIPPERIFLTAEEASFSYNQRLMAVNMPIGSVNVQTPEILPISISPGDAKKTLLLFTVLHLASYRNPIRLVGERLMQTMIACCLSDKTLTRDTFIHRTDLEASQALQEQAPVIPFAFYELSPHARIITKEELKKLAGNTHELPPALCIRADDLHILHDKPGTLVRTENGMVVPADDILFYRRGETLPNPLSFPSRRNQLKELLNTTPLYLYIPLNHDHIDSLNRLIKENPTSAPSVLRAIRTWTEDIDDAGITIKNPTKTLLVENSQQHKNE